jgi:hypothetical protein
MMRQFYLENDDYTYIYGGKMFSAMFDEKNTPIEPYIRKLSPKKIVKFYPSKNLFVVYVDTIITELIFVMTCWSDDYRQYNIIDNNATTYTECYHGKRNNQLQKCNIDFNKFIVENGL